MGKLEYIVWTTSFQQINVNDLTDYEAPESWYLPIH